MVGIRVYVADPNIFNVPAWRIVYYPTGAYFLYDSLQEANNSRIIARAMTNWCDAVVASAKVPMNYKQLGWSAFARHLNYYNPIPPRGHRNNSIGSAISNKLYGHVIRGTLPKDQRVLMMLYALSGYPWE